MQRAILALAILGMSSPVRASDFACFEKLPVPRYPLLASQALIQGSVKVTWVPDEPPGQGATIQWESTPPVLASDPALAKTLQSARLAAACRGKKVSIELVYVIDKSLPATYPAPSVRWNCCPMKIESSFRPTSETKVSPTKKPN